MQNQVIRLVLSTYNKKLLLEAKSIIEKTKEHKEVLQDCIDEEGIFFEEDVESSTYEKERAKLELDELASLYKYNKKKIDKPS